MTADALPRPARRRRWAWLAVAMIVIGLCGWGVSRLFALNPTERRLVGVWVGTDDDGFETWWYLRSDRRFTNYSRASAMSPWQYNMRGHWSVRSNPTTLRVVDSGPPLFDRLFRGAGSGGEGQADLLTIDSLTDDRMTTRFTNGDRIEWVRSRDQDPARPGSAR